jgi:hypothetical protein
MPLTALHLNHRPTKLQPSLLTSLLEKGGQWIGSPWARMSSTEIQHFVLMIDFYLAN